MDEHERVKAWEPFVRRAFELMDDPDGGKYLEDYLMSALDIPAELRPSPLEPEEPPENPPPLIVHSGAKGPLFEATRKVHEHLFLGAPATAEEFALALKRLSDEIKKSMLNDPRYQALGVDNG